MKRRDALLAPLLFLLVFGVYSTSRVHEAMDSRWSIHLAKSIITEGNLDLDEYNQVIPVDDYRTEWVDGHRYSYFPIGTPVLAVPFVYLCSLVDARCRLGAEAIFSTAELYLGSLFAALAVVLIYFIGRFSLSPAKSIVLALCFAFGTSAWSVGSRALWQVTTSMLLLSAALLLLLAARRRPWLVQFAGIPLAYSYFVRPTNSISIALITLYVFLEYRKFILGYLLGAALIAAPFFMVNLKIYGSLQTPYYAPSRVGDTRHLLEALAGNLVSPNRGLLIFSPVLAFSIAGIVIKARKPGLNKLDFALMLTVVLHWAAYASHTLWWGGWTFGPRQWTDMLPYIVFFLIPVVDRATNSTTGPLPIAFGVLLALSMFIHYRGATVPATFEWNSAPINLDLRPSRVWDWHDPQYLRGLVWFDRLIPQHIEVLPSSLVVLSAPEGDQTLPAPVTIRLSRAGRFDWKAEAGAGVSITPEHGENEIETSAVAAVTPMGYSLGRHRLVELHISARPSNDPAAEWQTVSVPVDLIVRSLQRAYLPSVLSSAR
jgi:hypothetical protein